MRKAACLLMLVAGCGGMPAVESTPGRATVEEVFARCREHGFSDSEIDVLLITYELGRDIGFTKVDTLILATEPCFDFISTELQASCFSCEISLVDFVYD